MRHLDTIVVHSTATPPQMDVGVGEVRKWHLERGFEDVGYHYVIRRDGRIERGRDLDVVGAHCQGSNIHSIGICYAGGGEGEDTRTWQQKGALRELIGALRFLFGDIPVRGHRDMPGASTLCPGFDATKEYNP